MLMVVGMMSALAAANEYTITVANTNSRITIVGKTFTAYKLFDLTLGNPTTSNGTTTYGAHSYSINSTGDGAWAWGTLTSGLSADANGVYTNTTYGLKFTPSASNPAIYVVEQTESNAFDSDKAHALGEALRNVSKTGAWSKTSGTAASESVTIDVEKAGYYLVYGDVDATDGATGDKDVVSAVILDSTNKQVTVAPKADAPTLDKKITAVTDINYENSDADGILDTAGKAAMAKVGSTVSFEIDSVVPDTFGYTAYTFEISDTMTNGLSFIYDNDALATLVVKVMDKDAPTTELATLTQTGADTAKYTLTHTKDTKTFKISIPLTTLRNSAFEPGDKIVVTYNAKVNENALETDFERNTAKLKYSNNPNSDSTNETPEKHVYVVDIAIDVNKYTGDNASAAGSKLAGAKFKLYRRNAGNTADEYYKWNDSEKAVTWVAADAADEFITGTDGLLYTITNEGVASTTRASFQGLDQGTYYLLETEAPSGYNKLANPITITISANVDAGITKITYASTGASIQNPEITLSGTEDPQTKTIVTHDHTQADVQNQSGSELPSTGGMGTTLLYVGGSILVVLAAILLITKRRMNAED